MSKRESHMDSHPTRIVNLVFDELVCHEWCTECHQGTSLKEMNMPWQYRGHRQDRNDNPVWPEMTCVQELQSYIKDALLKASYLQDCIETSSRKLPGGMQKYISRDEASPHSIYNYLIREPKEKYPAYMPGYVLFERTCPGCLELVRVTDPKKSPFQTHFSGSFLKEEYIDYTDTQDLTITESGSSSFHAGIHFRHTNCAPEEDQPMEGDIAFNK